MKFVRVCAGAGVATTLAAIALVGGAGSAHAAGPINGAGEAAPISGAGWVGRYWCSPDWDQRKKYGVGDVKIWVTGSDFNGRGQTMQFKVIDSSTNRTLGWSGWFEIPTSGYKPIAYYVPDGTWLRVCATFGGGSKTVPHNWRGYLYY